VRVGDKQWEEFVRLEEAYVEMFGEITFSNIDMTAEETIAVYKKALASGKPVYDDVPEGCLI
jgi:hypothetical protein